VGRLQNDSIIDRMCQRHYFLRLKKTQQSGPMRSSKRIMEIKGKRISLFILPLQGYMQQTVLSEKLPYILYYVT